MRRRGSLLLLLSFFCIAFVHAQSSQPSADAVMKAAYQKATAENKKVFVMFHASWCAWCHKMDTALYDPAIRKFLADNYLIEHLTVYENKGKEYLENPGALDLLTQYHGNDI